MKAEYFKVGGVNHMIDGGGNHFIEGKCVNPIEGEGKVGDTHPAVDSREPAVTVTGHRPIVVTIDENGRTHYTAVWE